MASKPVINSMGLSVMDLLVDISSFLSDSGLNSNLGHWILNPSGLIAQPEITNVAHVSFVPSVRPRRSR